MVKGGFDRSCLLPLKGMKDTRRGDLVRRQRAVRSWLMLGESSGTSAGRSTCTPLEDGCL